VTGGNGHKAPFNLRALLGREPKLPRGPFSGADAERLLVADGWTPEAPRSSDQLSVFRHPDRPGALVTINPAWEEFWEDDPIFNCLARDLGLDADELVRLLSER
jgi:hypothetical protein